MEKSVHTSEYATVLELLRAARRAAGVTQVGLARALDLTQSQVSKIERGETRLDIVQLREICAAVDVSLVDFAKRLERALSRST